MGDTLTLSFPVETAGIYRIFAQLTKSYDYAIVELSLNGKVVVESMDLYNADPMPGGEVELGQHEFETGEYKLQVKILGKNEQAKPDYMFGIDYIRLEKVLPS